LRLVPAMICEDADRNDSSVGAGFFGFGPKTPRHDRVPQWHS
jgi:hypothetical protein